MRFFIGFTIGWFLGWWYFDPAYACEQCDELKRWAIEHKYIISNEIYDLPQYSGDWFYHLGQEDVYDKMIEKINEVRNI